MHRSEATANCSCKTPGERGLSHSISSFPSSDDRCPLQVGVPLNDSGGSYILNVVVEEASRGRGTGKKLMKAAMSRAVKRSVGKGLSECMIE